MPRKYVCYTNPDEYSGDLSTYMVHTLNTHLHDIEDDFGSAYTQALSLVIPKAYRKDPKAFIKMHYEFRDHCGHDFDCCGCVTHAHVTQARRLNRRNWNIHVTFYRNV